MNSKVVIWFYFVMFRSFLYLFVCSHISLVFPHIDGSDVPSVVRQGDAHSIAMIIWTTTMFFERRASRTCGRFLSIFFTTFTKSTNILAIRQFQLLIWLLSNAPQWTLSLTVEFVEETWLGRTISLGAWQHPHCRLWAAILFPGFRNTRRTAFSG